MMYIRYLFVAPISFIFNLFVMVTSPIWAAWAAIGNLDRLPGPFALLHTHDDDIYGSNTTHEPRPATRAARFKRAVWWLCRNPGYGFDAYILGFPAEGVKFVTDISKPNQRFDDRETNSRFYIMETPKGKRYWGYRRDQMLFGNRYIKIWFGWHFEPKQAPKLYHMPKLMFNPFKTMK